MDMALLKQISMVNVFILLITCNADSTIPNSNFSSDHASIKKLVEPLSYDVTIGLPLNDFLVFHVESTKLIIIQYPTQKIELNVHGLTVKTIRLRVSRYPYMDRYSPKNHNYLKETDSISLHFDSHLPSGFYNIIIKFFRDIVENEMQVYRSCEDCGQARLIFTPQIERIGIFPSWKGDTSRARFKLTIKHPQNYTVLSHMPIQEQLKVNEFITETKFYSTPPVPIHLATFSLTDFACFTKEGSFKIRMCSASLVKNEATFALKISADVVSYMIRYMDMSQYRSLEFPEITIIGLPDSLYENTENWGFNIYSEDYLIYNEKLHIIDEKLDVSIIVASITAFQWINHLVSPVLWTHVWFCQTLALFFGAKAFAETYYDDDMSSLFTYQLRSLAREDYVINNFEDVDKLNTYNKKYIFLTSYFTKCMNEYGVMVMLENVVTESVFRIAAISYLKKHQFSSATSNDFWDAIQDTVNKITNSNVPRIAEIVHFWLIQTSLPVVTVTNRDEDFSIMYEYTKDVESHHISLPINWVTMSHPMNISNIVWLPYGGQIEVAATHPFDWIVVNWQHVGFYRVQYDYTLLKSLFLSFGKCSDINVLSRAHIIEDAYYFWTTKELNISMFRNLIHFISKEQQCAPWYAMQNIIQKMWIFLKTDAAKPTYDFIQRIFKQLFQEMGYTEDPNMDDTDCVKFKRFLAMKWACRLFDYQCLDIARQKLKEHLQEPERPVILPMWEEWLYCNGLVFSNQFIWKKVLVEYRKTGNKKILTYLICSEQIPIILKYLDLVMSKKPSILDLFGLNFEDRQKIYHSIVQKHVWKDEVMEHVFKKIVERKINNVSFVEELSYIIENVYSTDKLRKISSFLVIKISDNKVYNDEVVDSLKAKLGNRIVQIHELELLAK